VPLAASSPQVVAYLRRAGDRTALVVANLGDAISGVSIGSGPGALRPGTYAARSLLRGHDGASLRVRADGRMASYMPAQTLGAREYLVLDVTRR